MEDQSDLAIIDDDIDVLDSAQVDEVITDVVGQEGADDTQSLPLDGLKDEMKELYDGVLLGNFDERMTKLQSQQRAMKDSRMSRLLPQ